MKQIIDNNTLINIPIKIIIIGEPGVGKTSYINRYTTNKFENVYKPNIGVEFLEKKLVYKEYELHTQLWDIAGQERFGHLTSIYYRGAQGCFVMVDISRKGTLKGGVNWKNDLNMKMNGVEIPVVLLVNKNDLDDKIQMSDEEWKVFCEQYKFDMCFFTSAKENNNVGESMLGMIKLIEKKCEFSKYFENVKMARSSFPLDQQNKNDTSCKC